MWRSPTDNPFEPGHDVVPPIWAGRRDELDDWEAVRARRAAGQPERSRALLGEPGIGKSVLAAKIAQDAAGRGDIVVPTVRIPRGVDVLALVADALITTVEEHHLGAWIANRVGDLLDRVRKIAAVELAPRDRAVNPHTQLRDLLIELGRYGAEHDRVVLVRIDEVQNVTDEDQLSQLLVALGDTLQHSHEVRDVAGTPHRRWLPVVVYLTGLPEFTDRATSAAGATFARRFRPWRLGHIDDTELRVALTPFTTPTGWQVSGRGGGVAMTEDAIRAILACVLGDPFLFQLIGKAVWDNQPDQQVITVDHVTAGWQSVKGEARSHVERLVDRLPARERELVETMARLAPKRRTLTNIATELDVTATQLGSTAARLEDRGVIARGRPYTFNARTIEARLQGAWPDID